MRKRELLERIEQLEKRVRELEEGPHWYWVPTYPIPVYPVYPQPWRWYDGTGTYTCSPDTISLSSGSTAILSGDEQWSYTVQ